MTPGRTLITGCAGFIGSHLTESLLHDGSHVIGIDCFNNNYGRSSKLRNLDRALQWDSFEFVPVDLARGELDDIVADSDMVYHLAAEPGVRSSWSARFETYLRNNLLATHHLLDAVRASPQRFVYASSSSVYGQAEVFPTREDSPLRPFSPYGVTKLAAEHLCFSFGDNHDIPVTALRYFSVYGPRQRPDMAFTRFCKALLTGSPITIYGDGSQTRDFTYVGDVVRATRDAASSDAAVGGIYNIGGGSRTSLNETLDTLGELAGRKVQVHRTPVQLGDVRDTGADTERAERDLHFRPATDLRTGLARQLEWARELLEKER